MNSILIVGKGSFIGRNFIKYSVNKDIKVLSSQEFSFKEIDFANIDVLIHLAAIVHQTAKVKTKEYFRVNKDFCLNVAQMAKKAGIKHFVFISTIKVYGKYFPEYSPWNEDSQCNPEDAYGLSKLQAEVALREIEDSDFTVSIIRTPLVYGEGVKANMLSLIRLVERWPILPFKEVDNKRNYTYTENLVSFIDRIIEKRASGVFIAMDNEPLSTTDLIKLISLNFGKKIKLIKIPSIILNAGGKLLPDYFEKVFGTIELDNKNTKAILDFQPPISAEEGVKRMVCAYKCAKFN